MSMKLPLRTGGQSVVLLIALLAAANLSAAPPEKPVETPLLVPDALKEWELMFTQRALKDIYRIEARVKSDGTLRLKGLDDNWVKDARLSEAEINKVWLASQGIFNRFQLLDEKLNSKPSDYSQSTDFRHVVRLTVSNGVGIEVQLYDSEHDDMGVSQELANLIEVFNHHLHELNVRHDFDDRGLNDDRIRAPAIGAGGRIPEKLDACYLLLESDQPINWPRVRVNENAGLELFRHRHRHWPARRDVEVSLDKDDRERLFQWMRSLLNRFQLSDPGTEETDNSAETLNAGIYCYGQIRTLSVFCRRQTLEKLGLDQELTALVGKLKATAVAAGVDPDSTFPWEGSAVAKADDTP